jgi:hypothetical protein
VYPDDDGGYLRIFVGAYYKHGPYSLSGTGAPPIAPPGPPAPTAPIPTPSPTPTGGGGGTGGPCAPQISFGASSFSAASASAGSQIQVTTTFTARCVPSAGLIDLEVYNSAGQKAWQTTQDQVPLTGQAQTFSATWTIPVGQAAGSYTLKVGVFSAGWGTLYGWDDAAATLRIG